MLSSIGAEVGVSSAVLSVAIAAGASDACEAMLGLHYVVLPRQDFLCTHAPNPNSQQRCGFPVSLVVSIHNADYMR